MKVTGRSFAVIATMMALLMIPMELQPSEAFTTTVTVPRVMPTALSHSSSRKFSSSNSNKPHDAHSYQTSSQRGDFATAIPMSSSSSDAVSVSDDLPNKKKGFFGKLTSIVPPANERQKLIPLALMFFCILFNYTILRDTKDVLMITAPKSGAEVIPFIKTYVNLPVAIGFTGLYSKMCDSMELKNVFYACVIPFLIFFASFALFIYPHRAFLHPHGLVDVLAAQLPANFAAPLSIVRNWSFAVFYVMAEMWGSVVASLLFWGFANEVTTVEEAKKYCTFSTPTLLW